MITRKRARSLMREKSRNGRQNDFIFYNLRVYAKGCEESPKGTRKPSQLARGMKGAKTMSCVMCPFYVDCAVRVRFKNDQDGAECNWRNVWEEMK